jgi:hypothetical protein
MTMTALVIMTAAVPKITAVTTTRITMIITTTGNRLVVKYNAARANSPVPHGCL